jgi:UDP-N-acetylmuramate dehydrogenase
VEIESDPSMSGPRPVPAAAWALSPALRARLEAALPGRVRADVPLASLGRWRIGGPADLVVSPDSPEAVARAVAILAEAGARWTAIGEGSNVLFDSAGYRGVILRIGPSLGGYRADPATGEVTAEAGIWVPCFVRRTLSLGLAGCVHAIGIPGMLGGLLAMNGGSQRLGIGDAVVEVTAVDPAGRLRRFDRADCGFAYRASVFQQNGAVIVAARFRYAPADPAALRREAIAIMAARRRKFPNRLPNCGSVFVSDPALYATLGPPGAAIEAVGLKGTRAGGARISPLHANFIVNEGGARSEDVLALVALARQRVFEQTGITMRAEILHLPPDGPLRPAG